MNTIDREVYIRAALNAVLQLLKLAETAAFLLSKAVEMHDQERRVTAREITLMLQLAKDVIQDRFVTGDEMPF